MFSATLSISYHHICLTNNSRHFRPIPVHPATHPQGQPKSIHRHWRSVRPDLSNFNYQLRQQLDIPATPYLESVSNMNQPTTKKCYFCSRGELLDDDDYIAVNVVIPNDGDSDNLLDNYDMKEVEVCPLCFARNKHNDYRLG